MYKQSMAVNHQRDEILAAPKCSKSDQIFDTIIGHIEDIIVGDDFQHLQQNFMDKYCMQFEFDEENKLIYTDIHKEYVEIVENYLDKELKGRIPTFKMSEFQAQLITRSKELDGEVFEVLLTFTDFLAFKELALDYRLEKEGRSFDFSQGFVVHSAASQSCASAEGGFEIGVGAETVAETDVKQQNTTEAEPMRISLDFNDDMIELENDVEVNAAEPESSGSQQLNDGMDFLVNGAGIWPPAHHS